MMSLMDLISWAPLEISCKICDKSLLYLPVVDLLGTDHITALSVDGIEY